MHGRSTAFWLALQLFLAIALANTTQNTTTTGSNNLEARVGWYAGPTERGTLALVYSCLATIITCTWTVLHLNVPALKDGPWKKGFRKAKWMAITILFPEFIFAKAICELRSALCDLFEFDKTIRNEYKVGLQCKVSAPPEQNPDIALSWKTKFPRGRIVDLLYPLMGLPRPSSLHSGGIADTTVGGHGSGNVTTRNSSVYESEITSSHAPKGAGRVKTSKRIVTEFQDWTLTHSYLANMGGLMYIGAWSQQNELTYYIFTGAELSRRCSWSGNHPLQSLVLSEDDIKDKSKADWLLKTISILQISWLVLTVIARFILELPLTQLEIATLAFSFFAIATFTANWWKPKDISAPIRVPCLALATTLSEGYLQIGDPELHAFNWTQSFMSRLLSPAQTREESERIRTNRLRVQNDVVDMEGNIPIMTPLMAVAGFVFGGLHCLAWNFPFPSQTEMILWRVASIGSAITPFISLGLSIWLNYLVTGSLDKYFMKELQPLTKYNQDHFNMLIRPDFVRKWNQDERVAFYAQKKGHYDFEIPPQEHTQEESRKNGDAWRAHIHKRTAMREWHDLLSEFLGIWENSQTHKPNGFVTSRLQRLALRMEEQTGLETTLDIWEEYERSYVWVKAKFPPEDFTCAGIVRSTMLKLEAEKQKRTKVTDQASRMLAITSGIIYITTRVVILVLLFTSLRDVPIGVYESTPWTRFLPSFS